MEFALTHFLLNKGYKVITTEKVDNYDSTRDLNLTLFNISQLSLNIPNIIGVHSAVHVAILNKWNLDKNIIFFHNQGLKYQYPNMKTISTIQEMDLIG